MCIYACTKLTVFTGNRNNIEIFLYNDAQRHDEVTSLRSHVVGSSTERAGAVVVINLLFAHAKVSHFDVTVFVQQHVVQLQIPVSVTLTVQRTLLEDMFYKNVFFSDSKKNVAETIRGSRAEN